MKRQIPGLSQAARSIDDPADGDYLVRVARAHYRWDKNKPYYVIRFEILEPAASSGTYSTAASTALQKRSGNSTGSCVILVMILNFWAAMNSTSECSVGLQAWSGSHKVFDGHPILSLDAFAPAERWTELFGTAPPDKEAA